MTNESPEQDLARLPECTAVFASSKHIELDFDYPQILLQTSFASLLSHSFPSASSPQPLNMSSSQQTESYLSESWTSVDNAEYPAEDDLQSENTDLGSLVDINGFEDIHSLDEREFSDNLGVPTTSNHTQSDQCTTQDVTIVAPQQALSSIMAATQSQYLNSIEFKEPEQWPEVECVVLKHTVTVFDEADVRDIVDDSTMTRSPHEVVGTVRMIMSGYRLILQQPFKVFYWGNPSVVEAKAEIIRKIGDALVAGTDLFSNTSDMESSRYHVLPSEIFPGASPSHAEMVPIQTQMVVEECYDATSIEERNGQQQIILSMKKGGLMHSRWDGIWQNVQERRQWTTPNVAIIFVSKTDSADRKRSTNLVYQCMQRHHIPTLLVDEEEGWQGRREGMLPNHQSVHRCVEFRSYDTASGPILRRLPIDLNTFLKLDPTQLNKHMACLNKLAVSRRKSFPKSVSFPGVINTPDRSTEASNDEEKNLSKSILSQRQPTELLRQVMRLREPLMVALILALATFLLLPHRQAALVSGGNASSTAVTSASTLSACSTYAILGMTAVEPTTVTRTSRSDDNSIPEQKALGSLLSNAQLETVNKSDRFQVDVLGDSHVIVKTPHALLQGRREPKITVRITRGDAELASTMSRLFGAVYSVGISREEAYGPLNVTILVTKPAINETIQVDFGNQWQLFVRWDGPLHKLQSQFIGLSPFHPVFQSLQARMEASKITISRFLRVLQSADMAKSSDRARELWSSFASKVDSMVTKIESRTAKQQCQTLNRLAESNLQLRHFCAQTADVAKERAYEIRDVVASSHIAWKERPALVDFSNLRDKVQSWRRITILASAQDRAQKITRDVLKKSRTRRAASRKQWHGNQRCIHC